MGAHKHESNLSSVQLLKGSPAHHGNWVVILLLQVMRLECSMYRFVILLHEAGTRGGRRVFHYRTGGVSTKANGYSPEVVVRLHRVSEFQGLPYFRSYFVIVVSSPISYSGSVRIKVLLITSSMSFFKSPSQAKGAWLQTKNSVRGSPKKRRPDMSNIEVMEMDQTPPNHSTRQNMHILLMHPRRLHTDGYPDNVLNFSRFMYLPVNLQGDTSKIAVFPENYPVMARENQTDRCL
ncbi:hypothetical protein EDD17DRAFT_1898024 [Pisolithus thermaeus]|nr:hypothetical protein EDD17DRAFT_1898024 [Pisolithus thermaeus]